MKEKIKQFVKISVLGIIVFFVLLIANKGSERVKKINDKKDLDLKNGWITSDSKELPENYSPKKHKIRFTKINDVVFLQYKLIE